MHHHGTCAYHRIISLRQIDISTGTVSTIAGTGRQGNDLEGGKQGCAQELSSPWDVVMGAAPGEDAWRLVWAHLCHEWDGTT